MFKMALHEPFWISSAQVMVERRADSQIASLVRALKVKNRPNSGVFR
jgi:hypothetical protein